MREGEKSKKKRAGSSFTSAGMMAALVVSLVSVCLLAGMIIFITTYKRSMIQNVKTFSDQAAVQVVNIVDNYMDDIGSSLELIKDLFAEGGAKLDESLNSMVDMRTDVAAVTSYDPDTGELTGAWTGRKTFKDHAL